MKRLNFIFLANFPKVSDFDALLFTSIFQSITSFPVFISVYLIIFWKHIFIIFSRQLWNFFKTKSINIFNLIFLHFLTYYPSCLLISYLKSPFWIFGRNSIEHNCSNIKGFWGLISMKKSLLHITHKPPTGPIKDLTVQIHCNNVSLISDFWVMKVLFINIFYCQTFMVCVTSLKDWKRL